MSGNLIQYRNTQGEICVGLVQEQGKVEALNWRGGLYEMAKEAIASKRKLADVADRCRSGDTLDYDVLEQEKRLLPPVFHPDPGHVLVSGTGLTHLGSADTRAAMHAKLEGDDANLSDSMRMFRMGLEGGKPATGAIGVQPEWFYKGDGSIVVPPGGDVESPDFALDLGDEVEVAGIYIIGDDATPYRLGFAIGNEYSDHKTEKINYLYLAHSKLRPCSVGPELAMGELPSTIEGTSKIIRDGQVVWEKGFVSGEDHMSHSIANLEYHHFKYRSFLRPGDIHIHFFGTSTLSFNENFEARDGDVFEIQSPWFGRALKNKYRKSATNTALTHRVVSL